MNTIISKMRNSDDALLESEAKDIEIWKNLDHNKTGLECFLNFNIAELSFKTMHGKNANIICTSNTTLIKVMSLQKDKDKKEVSSLKSDGIHTNDTTTIDTWDLVDNHIKTVSLKSWKIMNFISIRPDNILLLD